MNDISIINRNYLRSMLAIAIPVAIQSLIQSSLSMIDQFMIGQLGADAIASVGLGARIPQIFIVTMAGVTSGAAIFTSQFWGKKDKGNIGQTLGASFSFALPIIAIFSVISILLSTNMLSLFTKDTAVIKSGAEYMKIIAYGYIPLMIVSIFAAVLRSTGNVMLPMYTGLISVVLNTTLNYLLIFGNMGMPQLGVNGTAIATTVSRYIECIILISVVYFKQLPCSVNIKEMLNMSFSFIKKFSIVTLPVICNEFLWSFGQTVYSAIYGQMGTTQIAAMTITFPVQGLSIGLFTGVSSAAGIMIGNRLGSNKFNEAVDYSKGFILVGVIGSIFVSILIVILSKVYVSIYNVSYDVQVYSVRLLIIFGMLFAVKVCNMICGSGILTAGGKTKFAFMLDLIGTWGIGVPLGLISAFVFKLSIEWVYLLISTEELVKLLIGLRIVYSKKWVTNIAETAVN
jgi:putative MATE family efflux protein